MFPPRVIAIRKAELISIDFVESSSIVKPIIIDNRTN